MDIHWKQIEFVSYELRAGALNAQSCRRELDSRFEEHAVFCGVREVAGRAAQLTRHIAETWTRDQAVSILREVRSIETLRQLQVLAVVALHLKSAW